MRPEEYTIGYDHIARCAEESTPAWLSRRERLVLYTLIYSLAPSHALEIGTFKGGSALIISGALDDVKLGGKLLCIEPFPEQIIIDWSLIQHNALVHKGFFSADMPQTFENKTTSGLFEFCFLDGDHSYKAVYSTLQDLLPFLKPGAFVLCHDAWNKATASAIQDAARTLDYLDGGMLSRAKSHDRGEDYGGLRLLKAPGELSVNS